MSKSPADHSLTLADGRRIAWREYGDSAGVPLIALHGTPGSRLKFSTTDAPARALGLRVIAPDRWGYGHTHPHPEPDLPRYPADISALAAHLGLARYAVMGISGGGPYAAAAAALLPENVAALALVAPVGPIAGEPDVVLDRFHRFCFGWFARDPRAPHITFRAFRRIMLMAPKTGMAIAMSRVPESDRIVLAAEGVSARLTETFIEGLRPGAAGPATDMLVFGRRWQLPLERATMPARLWLGDQDRSVPMSAARRLADRLPDCTHVGLPGEGHLWVAVNYAEVLRWVAEATGAKPPVTEDQAVARPPR